MRMPVYKNQNVINRISDKAIVGDHVILITPADFFRMQIEEINQFIKDEGNPSNTHARDNLAKIWISANAETFQEKWKPFIMPADAITEARHRINDHRWLESEKEKHDLHWLAELDWLIYWKSNFLDYWKATHPQTCFVH